MRNGIQLTMKSLGEEGCYLLCLLFFVEAHTHVCPTLSDVQNLVSKGLVRSDMFVIDPEGVLKYYGINVRRVDTGGDLVVGYTGDHFTVVSSIYGTFEPSLPKIRNYVSYRRFKLA